MKVVFLAVNDYANVGWSYMQALKSVNIDTKGFKVASHRFKYPAELEIITKDKSLQIQKIIDDADIIQVIHSSVPKIKLDLKKNIVIHHGGSIYRNASEKMNTFWNKIAKATIIETANMLNLGAKNEYYIPSPVDTDVLCPKGYYDGHRPLRIAHYPSSSKTKGTDIIKAILNDLKKEFNFDTIIQENNVTWENNIKRMHECDIYIDQFVPMLSGKRVGEYGVSTREAAALGKIVVSTHFGFSDYYKTFGDTKIFISNTKEDMRKNLMWLLGQSPKDIYRIQEETRQWVVSKHSYIPTGEILKNIYEKILFQ
jgi:hypothetical protein